MGVLCHVVFALELYALIGHHVVELHVVPALAVVGAERAQHLGGDAVFAAEVVEHHLAARRHAVVGAVLAGGELFLGKSGYEGVVYKNVIATYLHGPLLPKNPQVCDYLLERALKRKYGGDVELAPLADELERSANSYIAERYSDKKYILKETIKKHT